MTLAQQIADIKTYLTNRIEDRHLAVDGDDTDTLFDMLDAAMAAASNQSAIGESLETSVT